VAAVEREEADVMTVRGEDFFDAGAAGKGEDRVAAAVRDEHRARRRFFSV
jgi:hypothetical protein